MQFNQLRYVLEAADKKSFSAAAKSLFVSQPSLSQQIMNLEKELGIPLFIRHSKSVSLTEAGEYFVQSARAVKIQHVKIQFFADRNSETRHVMDWRLSESSTADHGLS